MGIPGLTKFINENFHRWEKRTVKGQVVIDGYALCHRLYAFEWNRGGAYFQFRSEVLKFIVALLRGNVRPIVIFDGVDFKQQKVSTTMKRRRAWIKYIHENINSNKPGQILPLLAPEVFRSALHELDIPLYVVDGEADEIIVEVANYFGCPVLGSDSDFFMYNIVGGYIPIDEFDTSTSPISCRAFYLSNFIEQFDLKHWCVRFAIPAILGNDFVSSVFSRQLITRMAHESDVPHSLHPVAQVMKYLCFFSSIEKFLQRMQSLSCYTQLQDNCIAIQSMYTCEGCTNPESLLSSSALRTIHGKFLPQWILTKYRQGNFPRHIMNALVVGKAILRIVPDVSAKSTSMDTSLSIRKKLYFLLNIVPCVTEYIRVRLDLSGRKISPLCLSTTHSELLSPFPVDIFCELLNCELTALDKVSTQWRFVVAVTKFWALAANVPAFLVNALIYCFVVCFTCNSSLNVQQKKCASQLTYRQSEFAEHLHSFSQWQCCYLDALSVNQLLEEPFDVLSPAFLYDGTIVLHISQNLLSVCDDFLIDSELYQSLANVLLYEQSPAIFVPQSVTTGPKKPQQKCQILEKKAPSMFVHANPFSTLQTESDSD